jgi:signal transduction histidine kinase
MPFRGDEILVRRLLLNLLDNAIKYTPAGGSIIVSCESLDGNYVLTIADTGSGIAFDDQPHIFDRFFRADKARTRAVPGDELKVTSGAGLGLSIAQWVAVAHRGELKLLSSSERGTTFVVILPAPKSPELK